MIIFEREKYLKEIKKNGIGATDQNARYKISCLMTDLLLHTSYRKGKVLDIVKGTAAEYFRGLPEDLVLRELEDFYLSAKDKIESPSFTENTEVKKIKLYKSEMETIEKLQDDRLKRLAFAALVLNKFTGQYLINGVDRYYRYVDICEADIYKVADFGKVSGTTKKKLWKELSDLGYVKFFVKTNPSWRYYPDWIAETLYTVPFNADLGEDKDREQVYKTISNYDDLLAFLRFYEGDSDYIECVDCGCPIKRTSNRRCRCSNCSGIQERTAKATKYQNRKIA